MISGKKFLLLLGFFLLLAFATILLENKLPNPIKERHISRHDANTFSEITAKRFLKKILGNQPRVSGTIYHFVKTRDLKELIDHTTRYGNLSVHTDWQYVDGDYWLGFSSPHVNVYRNLSNIIAIIEGESGFNADGTTGTSILVNCHYDSVPFAIGASDNGVFCAVMAETLSKLSRRKTKLKHNIIFLFNGAEENVLLGSHGFLSHPWSKGVVSVINLDSAGMNGRPNVFQVTDPRILEIYRKTISRPTAQGIGEFLFSTGIIPSDTDFRIWRDFGNITGIDIAFVKWGNVYHTRNDKPELIHAGVIQNAGNMLLNLAREMADCQELTIKEPVSRAVYYDYLGWFLMTYSEFVALLVDISVGVLGLLSVGCYFWTFGSQEKNSRSLYEMMWCTVGRVYVALQATAVVAICTAFMILATTQMRYLSEQWMVVPLYWIPYLVISLARSHSFHDWRRKLTNLSLCARASQAMTAVRLLMSLVMLALCLLPSLANVRYLLTVPLLVMSVASIITMSAVKYGKLGVYQLLTLVILLNMPATMFTLSLATRLNSLLIPIMGRSTNDYPDVIIAAANTALASYTVATVSGIELLFSRRRLWNWLYVMSIANVMVMLLPFSPYRDVNTTQRHYWFHTQVTSYDSNMKPTGIITGVMITKLDVHNVQSALTAIKNSDLYIPDSELAEYYSNTDEDRYDKKGRKLITLHITESDLKLINIECDKIIYCNMPMFRPRFEKIMRNSLFVNMGPPKYFNHSLHLVNRTCFEGTCHLNFVMNGPAHNAITLWPRKKVSIASWSFSSPVKETFTLHKRPVYTIVHSTATYSEFFAPLEFALSLNVPQLDQSKILLDVTHHAHKIHHPNDFTEEYEQLLEVMPEYFNIATFLTFRSNYMF